MTIKQFSVRIAGKIILDAPIKGVIIDAAQVLLVFHLDLNDEFGEFLVRQTDGVGDVANDRAGGGVLPGPASDVDRGADHVAGDGDAVVDPVDIGEHEAARQQCRVHPHEQLVGFEVAGDDGEQLDAFVERVLSREREHEQEASAAADRSTDSAK